ncbi:ATP-binding cassette domain-containing protein [Fuscibacter oryzae]|uniref:ATP-binding cassette domain-containing protein n=1 Tax=Fuscibacter oryzae TaxID=2803939 RepID=A0A8J7MTR5_9RHOB|nr:ATP-binding cassette domain-containing protein [Fuscibacter oryzae]MBL4930013.1 ATP-binding cassette domain-containing protein [Fuscibacter oryzae]
MDVFQEKEKCAPLSNNHVIGPPDINVDVQAYEITVITGLSGSGKSTLLSHLNGLIEPTAGAVMLGEQDAAGYWCHGHPRLNDGVWIAAPCIDGPKGAENSLQETGADRTPVLHGQSVGHIVDLWGHLRLSFRVIGHKGSVSRTILRRGRAGWANRFYGRPPVRQFKASDEIIRLAVMLYIRLPLLPRAMEGLLHQRDRSRLQHDPLVHVTRPTAGRSKDGCPSPMPVNAGRRDRRTPCAPLSRADPER